MFAGDTEGASSLRVRCSFTAPSGCGESGNPIQGYNPSKDSCLRRQCTGRTARSTAISYHLATGKEEGEA